MTHNQIAYWNYVESQRANKAKEFETARSNRAQEALLARQHDETYRHNVANEQETFRHNVAGENVSLANQRETLRHNLAGEALTSQVNSEIRRHNLAGEVLTSQANREISRSNRAQESIKWAQQNLATNQYFEQQHMNAFNKAIAQQEANAKTLTAETGHTQARIKYLDVLRQMRADDYNVLNGAINNLNSLFKFNRMSAKGGK